MVKAKCAKCDAIREFKTLPKKYCCSVCGLLNTPQPETIGTGTQACECLLPESFEWKLPVGEIKSVTGEIKYQTADDATGLTRAEWVEAFGYDPVIVKENMRRMGRDGVPGFVNTSSLGKRKAK
jgi:hypothetical protein